MDKNAVTKILKVSSFTVVGIILLKYIPMAIFGPDILFDASFHMAITVLILFSFWKLFSDKNDLFLKWFAIAILIAMAWQRIDANQHNLFGVALGMAIPLYAIRKYN